MHMGQTKAGGGKGKHVEMEIAGMAGNGWNGWKWRDMAGNALNC